MNVVAPNDTGTKEIYLIVRGKRCTGGRVSVVSDLWWNPRNPIVHVPRQTRVELTSCQTATCFRTCTDGFVWVAWNSMPWRSYISRCETWQQRLNGRLKDRTALGERVRCRWGRKRFSNVVAWCLIRFWQKIESQCFTYWSWPNRPRVLKAFRGKSISIIVSADGKYWRIDAKGST